MLETMLTKKGSMRIWLSTKTWASVSNVLYALVYRVIQWLSKNVDMRSAKCASQITSLNLQTNQSETDLQQPNVQFVLHCLQSLIPLVMRISIFHQRSHSILLESNVLMNAPTLARHMRWTILRHMSVQNEPCSVPIWAQKENDVREASQ